MYGYLGQASFTKLVFEAHPCCRWIIPRCSWKTLQCVDTPQFVYPFSCGWTSTVCILWVWWIVLLWTCVYMYLFQSVQFSRSIVSDSLRPHEPQHARPPCPSPNSCLSSRWCHPTISSCPRYFLASGSLQMTQLFASGGHSIGVSASASVLPMNIQGSFPLGWTGGISLQSKGLSRVFYNSTVKKHQFFGAQLSL